ncbi:Gfo/Idh/MocA family protein [Streptomyces sp. NPDC051913]|uniref:Gfo/Idh/MocA family protein n=1 Tax=Streptomyces sp. NPDC051913 TaxID=3365676 RepID=UPI0037D46210
MSTALGLGIVGWGAAGRLMAAATERTDRFRLAGIADISEDVRAAAARDAGCPVRASVEELAAARDVDVLYVASPTAHHRVAVETAAAYGKHVISEKPLAVTLEEAQQTVEAARRAGVVLLVGATHSSDAPVRALRHLVEQGRLGTLLSVASVCHTDWHRRPRSAADLDAAQGNGLVLRQGAHQFDILRYVCGGLADQVFAMTFGGSAGRERGFSACVGFADGAQASAYYSGTGGFDSRLLTWGVGELGTVDIEPGPPLDRYFALPGRDTVPQVSPVFGTLVATFSDGTAWLTPAGLVIHEATGVREQSVAGRLSGWDAVLEEMSSALQGRQPVHDGAWGVATLETCLAVHTSARSGAPVPLKHQVALPTASYVTASKEK